mmetsp:Transcript_26357/g.82641  ORF Transcript_26357/g.82641 Transcript_26357/m.82641 type:complete len:466 (+) Transcript_26357:59-1456(+)
MAEAGRRREQSAAGLHVLRAQMLGSFKAMVPGFIVVCIMALVPWPAGSSLLHLRAPAQCMILTSFVNMALPAAAARCSDEDLERNARVVGYATLAVRLCVHVVAIAFYQETSVFLKFVGVFMPVSASSSCSSPAPFKVFIVVQSLLSLVHFGGDLERDGAWLLASVVLSVVSLDRLRQQAAQKELRTQLVAACERERIAETTTKDIFGRLCDATASLSADGHITESSPQLPALLGMLSRNLQGRLFATLFHSSEPRESVDFSKPTTTEPSRVRHQQVRLADAYGQPIRVHIFHTTFVHVDSSSTTVLGIAEAWSPPSAEGTRSRRDGSSHAGSRQGERQEGQGAARPGPPAAGAAPPAAGASRGPSHARASSRARSLPAEREPQDADLARFWAGVASASRSAGHSRTPSRARSQSGGQEREGAASPRRFWLPDPQPAQSSTRPGATRSTQRLSRRGDPQPVPQAD